MSEITVIIPNYNGKEYIRQCLDSLMAQDFTDFEIIVVDNCSEDGSADLVAGNYGDMKGLKLIRLTQNFGFSRAVNEGMKASSAPFVLLLNSDTKADSHFVGALYSAVTSDKMIFSAASKMLQMKQPDRIDGAGDLYCALGWAFARGKGKKSSRYSKPCDVFAACAGAAIYRRSMLDETGWFDEFHFAYLEDIDIGYRARIMGYRNVYTPEAVVWHVGSGVSGSRYNDFKIRLSARNNLYVIMKNMPWPQILLNSPFLLLGFLVKTVFFTCIGHSRAYLSGLKRGYLLCREGRKFPYSKEHFGNYVRIQLELWVNLIRRFIELF